MSRSTANTPRITVVIPVFNGARFISQTIQSLLAQKAVVLEIIVIDDGSTDESAAMVSALAEPKIRLVSQPNSGVSVARNRGASEAQGDWLLFLDADDILAPNSLERYQSAIRENSDIVLIYGEAPSFDSDAPLSTHDEPHDASPVFARRPTGDALRQFLISNPITTSGATVVRKSTFNRTGGFPTGIKLGEDWALWCDIASRGPVRYLGPEPLLYYRIHAASAARELTLDPFGSWPAIDYVFGLESVKNRFSKRERIRLRRMREASSLTNSAQKMLRKKDWSRARKTLWRSIKRNPLAPRSLILWALSFLHYMPSAVRRRLK